MEIPQLRYLGNQILLIIDLNEKIISNTMTDIFANVGLTEAITHRHIATGLVPTYQIGSHPIDGIYTLSTLQVSSSGYLQFGISP